MQQAIRDLVIGKRVVSVSFAGPPARSVSYQMAQLSDLRSVLAEINRELGTGPTYRLGAVNNGLGGPSGPSGPSGTGSCR